MKEKYFDPEMEIIRFDDTDIITTSDTDGMKIPGIWPVDP